MIKKTLLFFSVLFILFCVSFSYAQNQNYKGDVSISDGNSEAVSSSNNKYKASTSVNNGIVFTETASTMDYILDTGVLASIALPPNNDIVFSNQIPSDGSISSSTAVNAGVTVTTFQGYLRQVKCRVSHGAVPNSSDPWYEEWDVESEAVAEKSFSVTVSSGLKPGANYIEWYAQNTVSANGRTVLYKIIVAGESGYVKIIEPASVGSTRPLIKAELYSPYGFSKSSVTISLYVGKSTVSATPLYSVTGDYSNVILDEIKGTLEYKYDGIPLKPDQEYSVYIEMLDNGTPSEIFSALSSFMASKEPIALLLPYPSPYNPKAGYPMKIKYAIDEDASVTINIYDRAGKFVSKVIDSQRRSVGVNEEEWYAKHYSGEGLANGIYICEIIAKGGNENRRYVSFAILRK